MFDEAGNPSRSLITVLVILLLLSFALISAGVIQKLKSDEPEPEEVVATEGMKIFYKSEEVPNGLIQVTATSPAQEATRYQPDMWLVDRFRNTSIKTSDLPGRYVDIGMGGNQFEFSLGDLSLWTLNYTLLINRPKESYVVSWVFRLDDRYTIRKFDETIGRGLDEPPWDYILSSKTELSREPLWWSGDIGDVSFGSNYTYEACAGDSDCIMSIDVIVFRIGDTGGGIQVKQNGQRLDSIQLATRLAQRILDRR